jgi:ribosomal protein L6P/L9E
MSTAESIASNASTSNGLSIMMAKKANDQMKIEGLNALKMIESAASVQRLNAPTAVVSSGGRVDGYA